MKPPLKPRKTPTQTRSRDMVEIILETTARILAMRGYAGTNTNLIAKMAGVSVGSIYQYFPNKDSLIAALHRRHALKMREMMISVLSGSRKSTLRQAMEALVGALLDAHSVEAQLHKVLELEFPLYLKKGDRSSDEDIAGCLREILESHRREITQPDLDLAAHVVLLMVRSFVHHAVLDLAPRFRRSEIEKAISRAVMGYLTWAAAESDRSAG